MWAEGLVLFWFSRTAEGGQMDHVYSFRICIVYFDFFRTYVGNVDAFLTETSSKVVENSGLVSWDRLRWDTCMEIVLNERGKDPTL